VFQQLIIILNNKVHLLHPLFPREVDSHDACVLHLDDLLLEMLENVADCLEATHNIALVFATHERQQVREQLVHVVVVKHFDFLVRGERVIDDVHDDRHVFVHVESVYHAPDVPLLPEIK